MPDAVAGRAGSVRTIEREHPRGNFRVADAAFDASQLIAIESGGAFLREDADESTSQFQRGFNRVGQPPYQCVARFHHEPINNDLDRVFLLLIKDNVLAEINQFTQNLESKVEERFAR